LPWHGYVQTFFDTSSPKLIEQLMADLQDEPPRYILYQRQLENLDRHERAFNRGHPLPHRRLDKLLMDKIDSGEWHIVRQQHFGGDSDWLLIDTSDEMKATPNSGFRVS
jgi:hypothetical protein